MLRGMKPVKALLFDLDDTLLDSSGNRDALQRTCAEIAAAHPGLDAARMFLANSEAWQAYWPGVEQRWLLGKLDTQSLSLEAWTRTLKACDCDDPALATRARDLAWQYQWDGVRLFDDALDLLRSLQGRYPLALITNGASDLQREKLQLSAIEAHFGAVLISGEVGIAKPDPAIFRFALEKLGVEADAAWHVGDNPRSDVGGAREAGLTAVWLNRAGAQWPEAGPRPEHEIRSLSELVSLLPDRE
jgi:putative hydrolase of the HAD superfamily